MDQNVDKALIDYILRRFNFLKSDLQLTMGRNAAHTLPNVPFTRRELAARFIVGAKCQWWCVWWMIGAWCSG